MKEKLFEQDLRNSQTLGEMLEIIKKYYSVETTKPGTIVKSTLINGLKTAVKLTGAKLR